jgi:hypothetical protein
VLFIITAMVVAGSALSVTASASDPLPTATAQSVSVRVERSIHFTPPWRAGCDSPPGDVCRDPTLFSIAVKTPTSPAQVDVSVTVTLDYRVSPGDQALVEGQYQVGQKGQLTPLAPFTFPLVSVSKNLRNSATLNWVKRGIPAAGRTYNFRAQVGAADLSGGGSSAIGTKLSVVIEVWPHSLD